MSQKYGRCPLTLQRIHRSQQSIQAFPWCCQCDKRCQFLATLSFQIQVATLGLNLDLGYEEKSEVLVLVILRQPIALHKNTEKEVALEVSQSLRPGLHNIWLGKLLQGHTSEGQLQGHTETFHGRWQPWLLQVAGRNHHDKVQERKMWKPTRCSQALTNFST